MTAVEEESEANVAVPVRRGAWLGELSAPLLVFSTTRVVQLLFLAWLNGPGGPSLMSRLLSWDGGWFTRVAVEGYPHGYTYDEAGQLTANGLAFFPLYPELIRALHALGVEAGTGALLISWTAAAAAMCLLYLLGTDLFGRRAALALTVLFATAPMSIVLSMAYTESLFLALVLGMFYAARRNAYLTAGVLGFLAGMTRPTGLAAALALGVAAVLAIRAKTVPVWRALVGALFALSGVPAYLLWVGLRVGEPDAWFKIQTAGWGTTFDWGSSTWDFLYTAFHQGEQWVQVSVALIIVAAVVAALLAIRHTWPPIVVYGMLALILVVGQAGFYHSKPRLLFPVLITLIPAAVLAGRSRPRAVALGLVAYGLFGLWYSAYLVAVWKFAI
jgi:4-amino-4-deoxy-L-arabinose transferase-like glycosyltransferase